jgi:hypothetical protein
MLVHQNQPTRLSCPSKHVALINFCANVLEKPVSNQSTLNKTRLDIVIKELE